MARFVKRDQVSMGIYMTAIKMGSDGAPRDAMLSNLGSDLGTYPHEIKF